MNRWIVLALSLWLYVVSLPAYADYTQRIGLGFGVADLRNPSESAFEIGVEYEYRFDPFLGVGGLGEYIFSDPGITIIGVPGVYLHPLATDFLVSGTPIIQFGSSVGTNVGVRLGTSVPLPLGVLTLIPTFAVDIISGGPNYILGLGLEF
jgi:hypothetical protein